MNVQETQADIVVAPATAKPVDTAPPTVSGSERRRWSLAATYLCLLTAAFARPLLSLAALASQNDLHSYIPLVPVITGYLLYTQRQRDAGCYQMSLLGATVAGAIGVVALTASVRLTGGLSGNDALSLTMLAYVSFVAAGGFLLLGAAWMRQAAFPLAFLTLIVPLPDAAVDWMEKMSVLASAEAAAFLFDITGTPMAREGTIMALPSITLRVAQECSGIRSSWVLVITSLLAANLFLKTFWRRALLVAFVIPLGIVRNGFRILVIGLLCEHVGPHMIDSPVHHRGGPLFFALSLGPLFLLMWWLRRGDRRAAPQPEHSTQVAPEC